MKKRLCALLVAALIACLACGVASAAGDNPVYYDEYYEHSTPDTAGWVHVNGNTSVRVRPEEGASVMEKAYGGTDYEYMNQTQYDGDGVAWYCVYCYGYLGWISSRSAELQWPAY